MWLSIILRAKANATTSTTQRKSNKLSLGLTKVDISGKACAVGKVSSREGTVVDAVTGLFVDNPLATISW
jgi:hypothetical protein